MDTTTDVIILSSSPERDQTSAPLPKQTESERVSRRPLCDSSPLPSPSELFQPLLRSRFFNKTADLLDDLPPAAKKRRARDGISEDTQAIHNPERLPENKPKRRGRKPKNDAQATSGKSTTSENKENAPTKSKGVKKKQADGGIRRGKLTSRKIAGKVTKPGNPTSKAPEVKTDGIISTSPPPQNSNNGNINVWEKDGLQLEAASTRKLDWTPAKNTASLEINPDNDTDSGEAGQSRLETLFSEYGFSGISSACNDTQTFGESGPTKRRRIELVDPRICPSKPNSLVEDKQSPEERTLSSAPSKTERKRKTQTKKITTITARVTAPYACAAAISNSTEETETSRITTKASGRCSNWTKKKGKSCLEFQEPPFILLSPEAAVRSLDDQDLVFGTCSQLESEEQPVFLRGAQIALQKSEKEILSAPRSCLDRDEGSRLPPRIMSRFAAPRNLWSVAARDSDGSLIEAEVLDLVDTPVASKFAGPRNNSRKENTDNGTECTSKTSKTLAPDTSDTAKDAPANETFSVLPTQPTVGIKPNDLIPPHYNGFTDGQLAHQIKAYGFKAIKNRKKMIETLKKCWESKYGPSNQEDGEDNAQTGKLSATLETSALSRPIKVTRKPRQTRRPGKRQPTQNVQQNMSNTSEGDGVATPENNGGGQISPSKPKMQTKRQDYTPVQGESSQAIPTRSFIDVEEIQDSEEELISSPSRLWRQSPPLSQEDGLSLPPLTQSLRSPSRAAIPQPHPTSTNYDKFLKLGDQITKAVRAQPRLSSHRAHSRPSWHEKILMYDPIILEDFTTWLNTEGLGLADEDREVDAYFVRQWCESKGICCCYKVKKSAGHH